MTYAKYRIGRIDSERDFCRRNIILILEQLILNVYPALRHSSILQIFEKNFIYYYF